jgi:hypothetical protein
MSRAVPSAIAMNPSPDSNANETVGLAATLRAFVVIEAVSK